MYFKLSPTMNVHLTPAPTTYLNPSVYACFKVYYIWAGTQITVPWTISDGASE